MDNQAKNTEHENETILHHMTHTFEDVHDRAGAIHYPHVPELKTSSPTSGLGFFRRWSTGNKSENTKHSPIVESIKHALEEARERAGSRTEVEPLNWDIFSFNRKKSDVVTKQDSEHKNQL